MPKMTKAFLVRLTKRFVNIIEMALVSLVTRVTSLPTGMSFSWPWERLSMWVKRSSRKSGDDALAHTLQNDACK